MNKDYFFAMHSHYLYFNVSSRNQTEDTKTESSSPSDLNGIDLPKTE